MSERFEAAVNLLGHFNKHIYRDEVSASDFTPGWAEDAIRLLRAGQGINKKEALAWLAVFDGQDLDGPTFGTTIRDRLKILCEALPDGE